MARVIVWWEKIRPEYKRMKISKQLYGWRLKKKVYKGMLEKANGEKLGANAVIVPAETYSMVRELFIRNKIKYKFMQASAMK